MAEEVRRLIVGGDPGRVTAEDYFLPPLVWYVLGSAAFSICGGSLKSLFVSSAQAMAMADALEHVDVERFLFLLAGMESDPKPFVVVADWLEGDEGQRRLDHFLAFLRKGDMEIVPDGTSLQTVSSEVS